LEFNTLADWASGTINATFSNSGASGVQSVGISGDGKLYALQSDGVSLFEYNSLTDWTNNNKSATFVNPIGGSFQSVGLNGNKVISLALDDETLFEYNSLADWASNTQNGTFKNNSLVLASVGFDDTSGTVFGLERNTTRILFGFNNLTDYASNTQIGSYTAPVGFSFLSAGLGNPLVTTAIPVPAAAWLALPLLGILGTIRFAKRRRAA